jgi:hypothetical protein
MLKKIRPHLLLSCIMLLLFHFSQAQKFTSSVSETFKADELSNQAFKLGNDIIMAEVTDNKLQLAYTFKLSKTRYAIKLHRYDGSSKEVKQNHLFKGERMFGPLPPLVKVISNVPYLIYPQFQEDGKSIQILASEIEPKELTIKEPKQLLQLDIEKIGFFKAGELLNKFKLILELSPDKSKLLCFWSSGVDNDYYTSVLNAADLKPLWNKKETVLQASKILVNAAVVDNNGRVFVSYKPDSDKDEYNNHIAVCQAGKRPKDIEIKLPDGRRPYQAIVVASKNGAVHIGGTYASISDFLSGVFYQSLSAELKMSKAQTTDFTDDLIRHLDKVDKGSWASIKPKKHGLMLFKMQGYELEDESLSLIGEFRGFDVRPSGHNAVLSGSMINLHFDGSKTTIGYIPKYRASFGSTIGDSYYAFPYKNQLLIFYNDYEDNLKLDTWDKFEMSNNYTKTVLVAASMESDGKIKREKIMDLTEDSFLPVGQNMVPATGKSLIIPISRIRKLGGIDDDSKWGTITID